MPILNRVHVAGLTNLTEGRLPNEHITFCYYPSATLDTVISRMSAINRILPLELEHMFSQRKLTTFQSFNDETILTPESNYKRHEKPFSGLFKPSSIAHITLAKNPPPRWRELGLEQNLNWDDGLLVDQCHAGFKHEGKLQYFNWEELSLWRHTGKLKRID